MNVRCYASAGLLLLTGAVSNFAQNPPANPAGLTSDISGTKLPGLTVTSDRTKLQAGKSYTLLLKTVRDTCSGNPFDNVSVLSSAPDEVTVLHQNKVTDKPCLQAVDVTVPSTALGGSVSLILRSSTKTGDALGIVDLTVLSTNPLPAGAVPPNLSPQLDIMWKILPRQVVADNDGERVADGFFAVEATFGNNTGYDIQVAALGFLPPIVKCKPLRTTPINKPNTDTDYFACNRPRVELWKFTEDGERIADSAEIPGQWHLKQREQGDTTGPILPVDAYPVVRGTVEREQFVGTRAIVVNLVRATGPVLLGLGGGITTLNTNLTLASGLIPGRSPRGWNWCIRT